MSQDSSGQSICLGEQQVAEWLEPDLSAVKAADDAVDCSPVPDRPGVHPSVGGQPGRSVAQVIAAIRVAPDDGSEVVSSLSAVAARIDELETAVRRLEHIQIVDVAVYQHSVSIIVGKATTDRARQGVLDGRFRARVPGLLPKPRQQVRILERLVSTRRQLDI